MNLFRREPAPPAETSTGPCPKCVPGGTGDFFPCPICDDRGQIEYPISFSQEDDTLLARLVLEARPWPAIALALDPPRPIGVVVARAHALGLENPRDAAGAPYVVVRDRASGLAISIDDPATAAGWRP